MDSNDNTNGSAYELAEILMVEDDPDDVELAREALKEVKFKNNLNVVDNGEDALRFLRREGEFSDVPRPDLILLDLNLPGMRGNEVLRRIKEDPELRVIPVVILTTSDNEQDILESYRAHANCFITKPVNFGKFIGVIQQIETFWIGIVKLPPS